ncbi:hypothetical protein C8R48DRAFT_737747 [Suillus tomentosus]|nr:hypothetical protein C8R48DRAFT_737747 [Suillus tomentosus]
MVPFHPCVSTSIGYLSRSNYIAILFTLLFSLAAELGSYTIMSSKTVTTHATYFQTSAKLLPIGRICTHGPNPC